MINVILNLDFFLVLCLIFKKYPMKNLKVTTLLLSIVILFNGCKKEEVCNVNGTSVNIGSTTGGNFSVTVYHDPNTNYNYDLAFNNTNLNFYVDVYPIYIKGTTLDMGGKTCLDYSTTTTPTAVYVSYTKGHGYYALFNDGHVLKFIANSYSSGSVNVTYTFQ